MIYGIQKLSLVDYPGLPSLVVFLGGCNFKCPFCHNDSIVKKESSVYELSYLQKLIEARIHFIDAIVVTGGEPTIYGNKLIELLKILRTYPLKIKLDSNGSNPHLLQQIIDDHLVDYIAMDIKNTFDKYKDTIGVDIPISNIKKSIEILENSNISYEFRTTINKTMHTKEDILTIKSYIKNKESLFLQPYKFNENQIEKHNFGEWNIDEIKELEEDIDLLVRN